MKTCFWLSALLGKRPAHHSILSHAKLLGLLLQLEQGVLQPEKASFQLDEGRVPLEQGTLQLVLLLLSPSSWGKRLLLYFLALADSSAGPA